MRHTIGGTWLLQLVIIFILLFAAFIILTLNYSRTVKLKNELIDMVEKYEGLNTGSITLVNNYLIYNGYTTQGVCLSSTGRRYAGYAHGVRLRHHCSAQSHHGGKIFFQNKGPAQAYQAFCRHCRL